jgi:hypothetical protein
MTANLSAAVLAESDTGKGSPIGLFVVLLLIIAVYFLYRSMSGHIRRLPEKFPQAGQPPADKAAAPKPPGTSEAERPGPGGPDSGPVRPA